MSLISQEKILYESKQGLLKLTSQKVRFNSVRSGSGNIVSIMLEHVTSCQIKKHSNYILLFFASLFFLAGGIMSTQINSSGPVTFGIIVAIVFVLIYFISRSQVLIVSSPSSQIILNMRNTSLEKVLDIIDMIEETKDHRKFEPRIIEKSI